MVSAMKLSKIMSNISIVLTSQISGRMLSTLKNILWLNQSYRKQPRLFRKLVYLLRLLFAFIVDVVVTIISGFLLFLSKSSLKTDEAVEA